MSTEKDNKLVLFEGRQIRKALHEGEWWFAIIDVIEVLVGGAAPQKLERPEEEAFTRGI
jgi:prophage antirepressor-like protein